MIKKSYRLYIVALFVRYVNSRIRAYLIRYVIVITYFLGTIDFIYFSAYDIPNIKSLQIIL